MAAAINDSGVALLVVDMQVAVVEQAHERDAIVARIADLVARARSAGAPVVWVQHQDANLVTDSPGWAIVAELQPATTEPLIHKRYGDAFEGTELEALLERLGVGRLVVTGAQTDACIRNTIHGAFVRGYDTTLVGDCHTTEDLSRYGLPKPAAVIAHTNMYWQWQTAPGRTAAVLRADQVTF